MLPCATAQTFPVSTRALCARSRSLSEASLSPDLTPSPFLFEDQPNPDPRLQDFHKGGYNTPFVQVCVCVGGVQEPSYREVRESYTQGHKSGVRRQPPCKDDFMPSPHQLIPQHPLLSAPSWHSVSLGERRRSSSDYSFPGFCALRAQPGTCRAEEATALRAPGK